MTYEPLDDERCNWTHDGTFGWDTICYCASCGRDATRTRLGGYVHDCTALAFVPRYRKANETESAALRQRRADEITILLHTD